jgi:tRNA-dihydrouridine synthase B
VTDSSNSAPPNNYKIGAAMSAPRIFDQVKHYFATGEHLASPTIEEKWQLIHRHCQLAVEEWGREDQAIRSMRARLMAYSKGFPNSKLLREKFQHIESLAELTEIAADHPVTCDTAVAQRSAPGVR